MNLLCRLLAVAVAAFFVASAHAQNAGTVTNHAFAIGKGAGTTGYTSLLCGAAQLAVGQSSADPICRTVTGDVTIDASGATAIGVSKVTNSQLNTMAANTTKCNATAGTANPTDCSASTMRTNMGVVIGTNVQAWDNDLDCIAALSATGQIKRTGSGTCSAGSVALSDLATGTQDTVIGYFGSTTASAVAISNCTGALTYSTSTHTFGCNTSAGTGTVTSVTCGTGLSGGTITTSGTCATDPAYGGWVLLNTLTASGSASLSDTTNITSSYDEYEIILENIVPATNSVNCQIQFSVSGFVTTGYLANVIQASGASVTTAAATTGIPCSAANNVLPNSGTGASGNFRLYKPSQTSVPKSMTGNFNHVISGATLVGMTGGFYNTSSAAVDGIRVIMSSGNIASGTVRIYGRK